MKILRLLGLALFFFHRLSWSQDDVNGFSCPKIDIPAESLFIKGKHPLYPLLVLYPKEFPGNRGYSGCAYAWLGKPPALYSIVRFEAGSVNEGYITNSLDPPELVHCRPGQKSYPHVCAMFTRFWTDAIAEPFTQTKKDNE